MIRGIKKMKAEVPDPSIPYPDFPDWWNPEDDEDD